MAGQLTGGVKNVGLVYIDAMGVSRKAVIKSVAKGMVVGRLNGGGDLIVGGGDGGVIPPEAVAAAKGVDPNKQADMSAAVGVGTQPLTGQGTEPVGFGNEAMAPPAYDGPSGSSRLGENIQGSYAPEKR
jgi:spartin